jgi:hypothetical protein
MAFRLLLQPLTASALAIRDGRRDLLLSGWREAGSVMIVAALVHSLFQSMLFGGFHPGAGLMAAIVLGALPYTLLRGAGASIHVAAPLETGAQAD